MFDAQLRQHAEELIGLYRHRRLMLATAESCTGGLVAALLTEIAGSSAVVERGFVTYSNEAKNELLGVETDLLVRHGAVSEPVAIAMVVGAIERSRAAAAVSITGIAGPEGGTPEKPIGLVHFAALRRGAEVIHVKREFGDPGRSAIRRACVLQALDLLTRLAA